jgi:hypothetical protein
MCLNRCFQRLFQPGWTKRTGDLGPLWHKTGPWAKVSVRLKGNWPAKPASNRHKPTVSIAQPPTETARCSLDFPLHPATAGREKLQIEDRAQSDVLKWTAYPLREHPGRAALALVVVLVCGLMVATSFEVPMTGLITGGLAMVVLLLSLNKFFLPSTFVIDDEGITAAWPLSRRHMAWRTLRRFAHDAEGGYLSVKDKPTRWDAILRANGMHVLFGDQGVSIAEHILDHMPTTHDEAMA